MPEMLSGINVVSRTNTINQNSLIFDPKRIEVLKVKPDIRQP